MLTADDTIGVMRGNDYKPQTNFDFRFVTKILPPAQLNVYSGFMVEVTEAPCTTGPTSTPRKGLVSHVQYVNISEMPSLHIPNQHNTTMHAQECFSSSQPMLFCMVQDPTEGSQPSKGVWSSNSKLLVDVQTHPISAQRCILDEVDRFSEVKLSKLGSSYFAA